MDICSRRIARCSQTPVCAEENTSVDMKKISAIQASGGTQYHQMDLVGLCSSEMGALVEAAVGVLIWVLMGVRIMTGVLG